MYAQHNSYRKNKINMQMHVMKPKKKKEKKELDYNWTYILEQTLCPVKTDLIELSAEYQSHL